MFCSSKNDKNQSSNGPNEREAENGTNKRQQRLQPMVMVWNTHFPNGKMVPLRQPQPPVYFGQISPPSNETSQHPPIQEQQPEQQQQQHQQVFQNVNGNVSYDGSHSPTDKQLYRISKQENSSYSSNEFTSGHNFRKPYTQEENISKNNMYTSNVPHESITQISDPSSATLMFSNAHPPIVGPV